MRDLLKNEIEICAGGKAVDINGNSAFNGGLLAGDFFDAIRGAILGVCVGFNVGAHLGYKLSGGGGWIAGTVGQAVGSFVSALLGAVGSSVLGFIGGSDMTMHLMWTYLEAGMGDKG